MFQLIIIDRDKEAHTSTHVSKRLAKIDLVRYVKENWQEELNKPLPVFMGKGKVKKYFKLSGEEYRITPTMERSSF